MKNKKFKKSNYKADLHNHTIHSDGDCTPSELIEKAAQHNLIAVGITDHDTLAGLDEAIQAGNKKGIKVVPGVEISLKFKRPFFVGSLHLLLYFSSTTFKITNFRRELIELFSKGRGLFLVEERINLINKEFGPKGVQPILKNSLKIDEILCFSKNVTRRHFAMALTEKHNITNPKEINQIIGNQSPAYVPSGIEMELLKPLIDKYPLLLVLAHPAAGSFPGDSHYKEVLPTIDVVKKLLPDFLELGINGIEVYYPGHSPDHRRTLLSWAEEHQLVVTGGSDSHDEFLRPFGVDGVNEHYWNIFEQKLKDS